MKSFVFRNTTVEPLFSKSEYELSGYDDINVIGDDFESYIWCYLLPVFYNNNKLSDYLDLLFQKFEYVCSNLPKHNPIIAFTIEQLFSINIERFGGLQEDAILNYNQRIIELTEIYPNLKIINFGSFVRKHEMNTLIDWKFYEVSLIQLNPKLASPFKKWLKREMEILTMKRKKCVVLDLDNTLWGGILGEDGVGGIKIGGDYPGSSFSVFQELLLELKDAGVILTVCSKNNESDVIEAWKSNKNILINDDHLAAYRINWNNKADNIYQLSKELNIGLDSMVFLDDNPVERELVKQSLPEVEVPEFPEKPYDLLQFTNGIIQNYFATYRLTSEDKEKTKQYRQNKERTQLANKFENNQDFLNSLGISVSLLDVSSTTVQRFSQMCNKTNQFNFTTKRYSEEDILSLSTNGSLIKGISVKDKFGDNGITGLIIVNYLSNIEAEIDTFLLSCRVLGKAVEFFFISTVLEYLRNSGIVKVRGLFYPTIKNGQVALFYDKIGFTLVSKDSDGKKVYEHVLEKKLEKLNNIEHIKFV